MLPHPLTSLLLQMARARVRIGYKSELAHKLAQLNTKIQSHKEPAQ
jgi:hypothetical protein